MKLNQRINNHFYWPQKTNSGSILINITINGHLYKIYYLMLSIITE